MNTDKCSTCKFWKKHLRTRESMGSCLKMKPKNHKVKKNEKQPKTIAFRQPDPVSNPFPFGLKHGLTWNDWFKVFDLLDPVTSDDFGCVYHEKAK